MTFMELAKARYSVRVYKDKAIEADKLAMIIEAGMIAPTAKNSQPQKIYVVQDPEKLEALTDVTRFTYGAPCVMVFAYDNAKACRLGMRPGYNFGEMDTTIVQTHMMLQAAELGLGTCWVGAFEPRVEEVLGIEDDITVVALMPLGYPADEAAPSPMHEQSADVSEIVTML